MKKYVPSEPLTQRAGTYKTPEIKPEKISTKSTKLKNVKMRNQ